MECETEFISYFEYLFLVFEGWIASRKLIELKDILACTKDQLLIFY